MPAKVTRRPKRPVKKFNWIALNPRKVAQEHPDSIWKNLGDAESVEVDYDEVETLFQRSGSVSARAKSVKKAKAAAGVSKILSYNQVCTSLCRFCSFNIVGLSWVRKRARVGWCVSE